MRPEETQIGRRVRVRMDHRNTNLRGKQGIIAKRWENPSFTALDVLLDDGNWQLFWYEELEEGGDNGTTSTHGGTRTRTVVAHRRSGE
jgi:hypothetical protein